MRFILGLLIALLACPKADALGLFQPPASGAGAGLIWAPNGNNARLPFTFTNSTSPDQQTRNEVTLVHAASGVKFLYCNYVVSAQGEQKTASANAFYDFNLTAGVRIAGTWYPLTFSGARTVDVPFGTCIKTDPLYVSYPAMTPVLIDTLRQAVIRNATNYNVIVNTGTRAAFGEGATNTATNYTTGGMIGDQNPATLLLKSIGSNGSVNFGMGYPGDAYSGYTAGLSLDVFDPTGIGSGAGISYAGMTYSPGYNYQAQNNSGWNIVTSLQGYGAGGSYSPRTVIGYYNGGAQIGQTTSGYGPSGVAGLMAGDPGSLMTLGNSWDSGVGADDAYGDEYRFFGIVERAFARQGQPVAIVNLSDIGNYAASFSQGNFAFSIAQALSLYTNPPTAAMVCDVTNDIASGAYNINQLVTTYRNNAAYVRGLGIKYVMTRTVAPRTTSTDGWTTTANQTPVAGFAVGGLRDQINADLTGGYLYYDAVVDFNPIVQDPTATADWSIPPASSGLTRMTGDGIHIIGPAIDYAGARVILPQVTAPVALPGRVIPPTITAGAAAGTGATATITGTPSSGTVTVNVGTSPTASAVLATIANDWVDGTQPSACTLSPQGTAAPLAVAMISASAPTYTGWAINVGSSALTASTAYTWGYSCR